MKNDPLAGLVNERGSLQDQIDHLIARNVTLASEITDMAIRLERAMAPETLLAIVATGFTAEDARLTKLRDECRRLLECFIEEGLMDRSRVNAAVTP